MKKTQMMLATLTAAFALPVFGADAPKADAAKPAAAAPVEKAAEKPATLEEVLAFLPETLAEVDGQKITKAELIAMLKAQGAQPAMLQQIPAALLPQLIQQPIKKMIEQQIFLNLAKKAGYIPSEALVRKEMDAFIAAMPAEQKKNMEEQLKADGKTLEQEKEAVAKNPEAQQEFAVGAFINDKFVTPAKSKVTDADAEKVYRENQQYFEIPGINVSHIIAVVPSADDPTVKPEEAAAKDKAAKEKMEAIAAKLKQGAKFDDLVKESEEPGAAERKGKLPAFTTTGVFAQGRMDPDFVKACLELKKAGDISGVVKTGFGYHIIRMDERKPQTFIPFDQVKDHIKGRLTQEKASIEIKKALEEAEKTMKVVNYTAPAEKPAAPAAAPAPATPAEKK